MPVEHDVTEAAGVAAGVVSDEVVEAVVSDAVLAITEIPHSRSLKFPTSWG